MENFSSTVQQALTEFLLFLPALITALVTFVVTLFAAGWISRLVQKGLENRKFAPQITALLSKITRWVIIILGTITALQQVDFDVTAFVAGLGVLGLAIGFALQDVTKNFVSGLLLLLQRPFEVGDLIEVNGYIGRAQEIDLRATRLKTLDGQDVLIPNSDVLSNAIVNFTKTPTRRYGLEVGVAYDSDLEIVEQVALDVIRGIPMVLEEPEARVAYHTFGNSSINFTLFYWVDGTQITPAVSLHEPVKAVKKAFDQQGIEIPFPIRTVYMHQ